MQDIEVCPKVFEYGFSVFCIARRPAEDVCFFGLFDEDLFEEGCPGEVWRGSVRDSAGILFGVSENVVAVARRRLGFVCIVDDDELGESPRGFVPVGVDGEVSDSGGIFFWRYEGEVWEFVRERSVEEFVFFHGEEVAAIYPYEVYFPALIFAGLFVCEDGTNGIGGVIDFDVCDFDSVLFFDLVAGPTHEVVEAIVSSPSVPKDVLSFCFFEDVIPLTMIFGVKRRCEQE